MNSESLYSKTFINKLDLLKKEVIIQWKVWLLFATKLIESIPDACNVREHYQ